MKLILRTTLTIIVFVVVYVLFVLLINALFRYQPDEVEVIDTYQESTEAITDTSFQLLMWNIGYAGLGKDSDFFYDGGKMVRSPKSMVKEYWQGIHEELAKSNADFILLQEVDVQSKRSWKMNQKDSLSHLRNHAAFAKNYDVPFVPLKLLNPLGRVKSGLCSFSNYEASVSQRAQYPSSYPFPKNLFFLKRCLLDQRYALPNGKDLIIINTHLSAYDDGKLKAEEMNYLKNWIKNEYESGNYVIVGADWNQTPQSNFITTDLPNWRLVFDNRIPTNRSLDAPLSKQTDTQIIDYFLTSPNVDVQRVQTVPLQFKDSDHNPVLLEWKLNY